MHVLSFRLSRDFGLALLAAWPAQVLGLVALGAPLASTASVAILMLPLALSGACVWLRAGQRHPAVFRQKRLVFGLFSLAVLVLVLSSYFQPTEAPTGHALPECYSGCVTSHYFP